MTDREFSIAPMLDVSDRHFRVFMRLLSKRVKLYTEMIVSGAILHGDTERLLGFQQREHPVALQLGGSDPTQLAECARIAAQFGYDEVNLNVGCPSSRVNHAQFGACLMEKPELVAQCMAAMREALESTKSSPNQIETEIPIPIPVTVKTRIGIDDHDSYEYLAEFIQRVSQSGCEHFIIHARKAWLNGLSPKQNRNLPPLCYDRVYRLKQDFPQFRFVINGGITTLTQALEHLQHVDGVMVGREAWHNPWLLHEVDQVIFNDPAPASSAVKTRVDAVQAFRPYVEQQLAQGVYLRHMTRHMLGLFHGQPGARAWRRHLSEHAPKSGAGLEVIDTALQMINNNSATENRDDKLRPVNSALAIPAQPQAQA